MTQRLLLGFPDYGPQARALAERLGCEYGQVAVHRFPDGESLVQLPERLPEEILVCRTLAHPNDKLVELLLTATTARELGARHLTLVAPYLCYMRQDTAFAPGQAVSQRIIGGWLAGLFDAVVTVDPHLHRTGRLDEAVPARRAVAASAARLIGDFLIQRLRDPMIVGPDAESEQWVRAVAWPHGLRHVVAHKDRHGDREVAISIPAFDPHAGDVVLVDDVASTGETLIEAARVLKSRGVERLHAVVVHALLIDDALERIRAAGVQNFWSTDSIPHPSNVIELAPLLADAV